VIASCRGNDKARKRRPTHLSLPCLKWWNRCAPFQGSHACLIGLSDNVILNTSICNSRKGWLSFLEMRFGYIPQNGCPGVFWNGYWLTSFLSGLDFLNLFIILPVRLLRFCGIVPHCRRCILYNFKSSFPVEEIVDIIVSLDVKSSLKNLESAKCDSTLVNGFPSPLILFYHHGSIWELVEG